MKLIFTFILIALNFSFANQISGHIKDEENGNPLIGASVRIKNSNYGTYTNSEGYFSINGFQTDSLKLLISMLGYKNKEISVNNFNKELLIELNSQPLQTSGVIVSANKRVQSVQEIPISVSVIDSREINIRNITKAEELIRYVPGVEVNQDNISIRGSSGFSFGIGSRITLLVDGFPLISGDNADVSFDALPLYNIERIEVIKGAGSALYGSSALGGVINIITSDPKPKGEFKTRLYSGIYTKPRYNQWEYSDYYHHHTGVNTNYSKNIGNIGFNIGGSYIIDESYQQYRDEDNLSFNGKLNYDFSDFTSLAISSNINFKERADWVYWESLNKATLPPIETNQDVRIKSNQIALYSKLRHIFNDNHFMNLKAGVLSTEFENSLSSDDNEYRQSVADNINIELQMNSNITENHMLTYGLNYYHNMVNSSTYGNQQQQIISSYAQSEYGGLDDLVFNIGARFDYENVEDISNDFQISPKAGISININEFSQWRISGGTGFRAPAVAERFASVSFQGFDVIQNQNLKPEKSISLELGYNFESDYYSFPLYLDISVFNNEFYDLIEPGFVNESSTIQFQNLTRARIFGSEINIKTFLMDLFGLETSFTILDPENLITNEILKYRSEFIWYSRILFPLGNFTLNADYRYKSKVKNIDNRLSLQIKDYDARVPVHIFDLSISYDLQDLFKYNSKITLFAKNLFDYYYTEIPGNLAQTRYIGLQFNFMNTKK